MPMHDRPLAVQAVAPPGGALRDAAARERLRSAAEAFEAMFLAQMLSEAGLGRAPKAFGGGAGEAAFSSLLVREQAKLMAHRGGIGLAQRLVQAFMAWEALE
jgi:Rod binding domain-containing protein